LARAWSSLSGDAINRLFLGCRSTAHAKSGDAAHRARNHQFFVRANDADLNPAGVRGNHIGLSGVARLIQFEGEKAESLANPCANSRRILADASGEDE